jgi:citrate synthase
MNLTLINSYTHTHIGPRFGGALDDAAAMFMGAVDEGVEAEAFVKNMRKQNKLIMGIGTLYYTV